LDLSFQCDQSSIAIPVAQLFLQELGAQVLDQLVAVLATTRFAPGAGPPASRVPPARAAAQPGVTERPGELPHHLTQRPLLAEERHFIIGDTGASGHADAGLGPQVLADV